MTLDDASAPLEPSIHFPMSKDVWETVVRQLNLTPTQMRVVERLLHDRQNKQIAFDLESAPPTINSHLKEIYRRTNTTGRTSLVLLIFRMAQNVVQGKQSNGHHSNG